MGLLMQSHALVTNAQNKRITLRFENSTLKEVLQKLEDETEFSFIYKDEQINSAKRITDNFRDEKVTDLLTKVLKSEKMTFMINGRVIVILPDNSEFLTGQQQKSVSGKVTDSSGAPLPGTSVLVKGTTIGVITDNNGYYSLINIPENATLQFSFVGMKTHEIAVGNNTTINVTLAEETIDIEEVVAIGYGTQKKINVIGSLSTVSSAMLNTAPVSMISNALAGRMPGAIIQQGSGEPGYNASTILIRGKATLGNNSPLVVVDGIPGRDMNSIQSTDVESITILKDASAGIYGARAANGVILITTKRGTANAPAFSFSASEGVLSPTKLPEMCDAPTYAQMLREVQSYRSVPEGNMTYSLDDIEKFKSGNYPWTHPNTDWLAEGMRKYSRTSSSNLSVNGGTKNVTYYGSLGTTFDDNIFKNSNTNYRRYNLKTNIDAKVNKYFSIGLDISASQENRMRTGTTSLTSYRRMFPTWPAYYPNGLPGPDIENGNNPVVTSSPASGFSDSKTYTVNSKISATFNVPGVSGLVLSGYYAYDLVFGMNKSFNKGYTLYSLDKAAYLNAGNTGKEDGSAFLIAMAKGTADPNLTDSYNDYCGKLFNFKASYDKTIGGKHNISAFIAVEQSDYLSKGISAYRRYFISTAIPYLFAGSTTDMTNSGSVSLDASRNYFGRVMYNLKETYLLQFSLRRDGSLRFSEENGRWGTFPSILLGWRISNENFWKNNVRIIDYFKLKASFGQMGNDQVAAFQYLNNYAFATGSIFGSGKVYTAGLAQNGVPNPLITWEVANVVNAGFEANMFNSKLMLNADFFYQRRSNILVKRNASVPGFIGISLPDENFGIVDNKGFELELGYNDRKGDFSFGINGNIAYARNKVIEFDEPVTNVPWQTRTGHPQGILLLYQSLGIFKDQTQVNALPHVTGARPGDIIIADIDTNGVINQYDKLFFEHTADPELSYGVSFNLGYKNWNLSGLIQGIGTTMRSMTTDLYSGTMGNYYAYEAEDRWTVDNIDATKPRAYEREEEYWRSAYATNYNYQKGSYARLKNLQLTYTVPQRFLKVAMVKEANLYFSGENLFLIYNQNKIIDPELGAQNNYPLMRVCTVGLKISF